MKKVLLAAVAMSTVFFSANAQRMTLHEEFTGENCGPCAATNPGFWTLCNSTSPVDNPSKLIHIAYMAPIPSSGWFYLRSQVVNDARRSYYSCTSAPFGKYDGNASVPTHPASFTQAMIDAEAAIAAPFNVTCTSTWDATYDTVISTITVTCVTPFATTTPGSFKLRAALVQNCDFTSPPGSNGEMHFQNIVQDMYPSAAGTTITDSWTAGMTQTYTIKGKVPNFVTKGASPFMVVWLQDDVDKNIKQAAKSANLPPVPNDAEATSLTTPGLVCTPDGSYSAAHSVTIKNAGTATLTSCTVYYNLDGGAWSSAPWTGSLATGASTTFALPATSITVAGPKYHYFYDSLAAPNGVADQSMNNNVSAKNFFLESTTLGALPYSTSYETADLGKFYASDDNNNLERWTIFGSTSSPYGKTGSNAAAFQCYGYAAGETEVFTLPELSNAPNSELTFWEAYCQYDATSNDKLEVVYSTNCGSSWTSLWSASGTTLSTSPISTSVFVASASKYVQKTVSLATVPAGAMLGFRATSDYGNNIWIDDINVHAAGAVNKVAAADLGAMVFPNPAKDNATLTFSLSNATEVNVTVVDAIGRTVANVTNGNLGAGVHNFTINTTDLAGGAYNVVISTDGGVATQRLTVVK